MSTRAIIARKTKDGWEGVYHHWDGYPSELGKEIWNLIHNQFHGSIEKFLEFAIDEHPAGWSHIFEGYIFTEKGPSKKRGSQCFCHGYFEKEME